MIICKDNFIPALVSKLYVELVYEYTLLVFQFKYKRFKKQIWPNQKLQKTTLSKIEQTFWVQDIYRNGTFETIQEQLDRCKIQKNKT